MNLARNIGGSVGISFVTTMLDRRSQKHLTDLTSHLTPANAEFQAMVHGIAQSLVGHGINLADARQQAYGVVQNMVERQATMLAYIDNFQILGYIILAMIPLVFLMKRTKAGGEMAVH
jgi:DHA2 family multidrug resistance protein